MERSIHVNLLLLLERCAL